jgi:hypothetical protein
MMASGAQPKVVRAELSIAAIDLGANITIALTQVEGDARGYYGAPEWKAWCVVVVGSESAWHFCCMVSPCRNLVMVALIGRKRRAAVEAMVPSSGNGSGARGRGAHGLLPDRRRRRKSRDFAGRYRPPVPRFGSCRRWCGPVERMVPPSGTYSASHWKEKVRSSGSDGAIQWNFMVRYSGR